MKIDAALLEVLEALGREGFEEVEVFHKRGRSRTLGWAAGSEVTSMRQEEGWAVRAGDRRRSFLYAATGAPRPDTLWPEADGSGLRLPSARPVPHWTMPSDLDAPLIGENDAHGLFEAVARELDRELPGARLMLGQLDDGSSESQLVSSRESAATVRQRAALLRLEAVGPGRGRRSLSLQAAERETRRMSPSSLARRLADRLLIAEKGTAPRRDRGELLLAPAVVIALLESLSELWIGPRASEHCAGVADRRGRIGSPALTLIDNGRLPGAIFEAPVDGEGQPTREVVVVEEGRFRQPLLAWWQATGEQRASGCSLRPSWRDLPRPGPTHFYLQPDPGNGVAALLGGVSRGYYLLDVDGAPRLEAPFRRFAVPVAGFAITGGRSTGPISGAWLTGSLPTFLHGILAAGRDLTFLPSGNGMVGAPTLLVKGLELRGEP